MSRKSSQKVAIPNMEGWGLPRVLSKLRQAISQHKAAVALIVACLRKIRKDIPEADLTPFFREYPALRDLDQRVADGQVLPETIATFGYGSEGAFVAALDPKVQRLILDNSTFPVVQPDPKGTVVNKEYLDMTLSERRQVFAGNRLQTATDQRRTLASKTSPLDSTAKPASPILAPIEAPGRMKIDLKRKGFYVGRTFLPFADVDAAVRAYRRQEREAKRKDKEQGEEAA